MTEGQQEGARPGLGEAVSLVAGLVRGVSDDDLARPTPCPGTSVAAMLDHLAALTMAFTAAARHEPVPGGDQPPEPDASRLDPAFRESIPVALTALPYEPPPDAVEGAVGFVGPPVASRDPRWRPLG